jgi:hypothetical protein
MKELMENVVNVVSLPGKFNSANTAAEGSLIFDQFAEAVGDLTDSSARRVSAQPRDLQWRVPLRNALDKIKNIKDLNNAADELASEAETVLANMDAAVKEVLYASAAVKEVLYASGWAATDTDLFCLTGLLPCII